MSRHSAPPRSDYNLLVGIVMVALILITLIGLVQMRQSQETVGIPTDSPPVTAETTTLSYDSPLVTSTPAPAPTPAATPIPFCERDDAGPGKPACHWDAGERGGPRSYVWTGDEFIYLIDPQP